jgi:AcrR family transcriptional regulator
VRRSRRRRVGSHAARKERTRRALLHSALALLSRHSFGSLSLREVTRETGITPTAFYRHFASMEDLGLALVGEAFGTLHDMLRTARTDATLDDHVIRRSVEIVVAHVREHGDHMRFLARERYGGVRRLRRAIELELELFANELAVDLSRFPELAGWTRADRHMFADLLVETVVSAVGRLTGARPGEEAGVARRIERQLRLIVVGVPGWRSRPEPLPDGTTDGSASPEARSRAPESSQARPGRSRRSKRARSRAAAPRTDRCAGPLSGDAPILK